MGQLIADIKIVCSFFVSLALEVYDAGLSRADLAKIEEQRHVVDIAA